MITDDAWEHVHRFQLRIDNLGRIGDLRSQMVEMIESDDWQDYTSAIGRQRWQAAEFDYFLIDCGVSHEDARRAIEWSRTGTKVAAAMDPDADPALRRPIGEAAREWQGAALNKDFLDEARRLGWLADDGSTKAPVSQRALHRAHSGLSFEAKAREARTERLSSNRRRQLDAMTDTLLEELATADERRYVIDRVRSATHGHRRPADAGADAERLGWNVAALAAHWGVPRMTAHRWVRELRDASEA
jgi:hypothetical protein